MIHSQALQDFSATSQVSLYKNITINFLLGGAENAVPVSVAFWFKRERTTGVCVCVCGGGGEGWYVRTMLSSHTTVGHAWRPLEGNAKAQIASSVLKIAYSC
jgi:hypothetical protein